VGDFNLGWTPPCHACAATASGDLRARRQARRPIQIRNHQPDGRLLPLKSDPLALRPSFAEQCLSRRRLGHGPAARPAEGNPNSLNAPISIYEVHLGSWRRRPHEGGRWLSYREFRAAYARDMGFTHVEFLHQRASVRRLLGYQPTGLFAPTSRFSTPADFAALVDACHAAGLAVILDWVPGHFPDDPHGLGRFDGTALYEHEDPKQGRHLDWNTLVYNFGRTEVANFLQANSLFWLDRYRVDGLRVDAVASMLYLDYSRPEGGPQPARRARTSGRSALRPSTASVLTLSVPPRRRRIGRMARSARPVDWGGTGFGLMEHGLDARCAGIRRQGSNSSQYHYGRILLACIMRSRRISSCRFRTTRWCTERSLLNRMPGTSARCLYAPIAASCSVTPGEALVMGGELRWENEWRHDRS
jgi:1,4-alpha-glucan branching enzyme